MLKRLTLSEEAYFCYMSCNAAAFSFPNSYAHNFDDIVDLNKSKVANEDANLRMAAIAPFAVNPIIRKMKSLGFYLDSEDGNGN